MSETMTENPLRLTELAVEKVREFAAGDESFAKKSLRVYIEGGGCSGFRYGFAFDDTQEEDSAFEQDGVRIVVDPVSLSRLQGSVVDFVDDFRGAGFMVQNPNATGTCGCGQSFSA